MQCAKNALGSELVPITLTLAILLGFAAGAGNAGAQQQAAQPQGSSAGVSQPSAAGAADPDAHREASKLVAQMDAREKILASADKSIQNGAGEMVRQFPKADPRFVDEWKKRMRAEFNPDDYVNVIAGVYEKPLNASELDELIAAVRARKESKPAEIPAGLREKFAANAVDIQSEILGGCAEVGAKAGMRIAMEIGKEHPDWVKDMNRAAPPAEK